MLFHKMGLRVPMMYAETWMSLVNIFRQEKRLRPRKLAEMMGVKSSVYDRWQGGGSPRYFDCWRLLYLQAYSYLHPESLANFKGTFSLDGLR